MANIPPPSGFPTSAPSQYPPGYAAPAQNHGSQQSPYSLKQEFNSISPQPYNNLPQQMYPPGYTNNFGPHSSNNSPAFNKSVPSLQPQMNNEGSPNRPLQQQPKLQTNTAQPTKYPVAPTSGIRPAVSNPGAIPSSTSSLNQYPPSLGVSNPGIIQNQMQSPLRPQQPQWAPRPAINPNAPPLVSSSQPLSSMPQQTMNGPSLSSNVAAMGPPVDIGKSVQHQYGPPSTASGVRTTPNPPINGAPVGGPPVSAFSGRVGPSQIAGTNSAPLNHPAVGVPSTSSSGLQYAPNTGTASVQPHGMPSGLYSAPQPGHPSGGIHSGPPLAAHSGQPLSGNSTFQSGGPASFPSGPPLGPQSGPPGPSLAPPSRPSGPPMGPPSGPAGPQFGPQSRQSGPPLGPPSGPPGPSLGLQSRPPGPPVGPPSGPPGPTLGPPSGPPAPPLGPPSGPTNTMYPPSGQSSMNSRYPQNVPPQPNYNQGPQSQPNQNYQQYNGPQSLNNQMGQMSITQAGFNQMWGQQMFDLLQQRHILPEYPEDPPEIRLGQQFAESNNCSPEIFRCTVNRIPETNALLQKSRLPLGILIHPFKDLNHLPVIQCTSIVRCRACRTYINPFVYFVDSKRWKCNLCFRVNDLPEEFQYDPVSKSYGDPSRRPEIKSATIEFIAPGEYMLRPPQPAIYLFLLDVSQLARESEYLQVFCDTLKSQLDQLPGDARTQVGFICYDSAVHFYLMGEGLTRPREMTVIDIDDVFLPSPESLLVNLGERREMVQDLLDVLPRRHAAAAAPAPASALGAALQAAYKLMAPTGGRVTVIQTCLPNVGPGGLTSREDPNARSSKDVAHLNPATDFYKRLALECSGAQVAVDLFLINSQYSDLATLSGISKFSGGTVYHIPLFKASRGWQAEQFRRMLTRYLTRKVGFEAVMRVRCTRGISIHTFHGNFFVRSTDLLSLPNVSPDAGFGMQLTIEESLSDMQQICFQAALLYTSSKGERRIRVHTMCLPVANNLTDVLHSADQQCIIGLLTKMAVDRCQQSSLGDAREALSNVAVDTLLAHRLAQNLPGGAAGASLHAPACLRLLPLYLSALLKHPAFRVGTSTRLDDRVAAMCHMKTLPLAQLMRSVYPDLYPLHELERYVAADRDDDDLFVDPPRLHLTAERLNSNGAYLLDDGETMLLYIGHAVDPAYLAATFGVAAHSELPDESRQLPQVNSRANALLHAFVDRLNEERPYAADVIVLRDNSPSRRLFTDRLVDDRMESAFSYYEFLQHVKSLMK